MSVTASPDEQRRQREQVTAAHWQLDPQASTAEFRVPNLWGLGTVHGHFDSLDGHLEIDESGQRQMQLTIDASSLRTGNRRRDEHLRSAAFFDCDRHPEVRFRSTAVSDAGEGRLRVQGELEAAGKRVQLQLEASIGHTEDELEVHADTPVDQRLLGMTVSRFGIRTPATLTVHARLRRPPSPAGSGWASRPRRLA
jgi:polyisoprenoid-binding protein YceI